MPILYFLFLGWILSLFNIDTHLVNAVMEWTGKELTVSTYWAGWFLLGLFFTIVDVMVRA